MLLYCWDALAYFLQIIGKGTIFLYLPLPHGETRPKKTHVERVDQISFDNVHGLLFYSGVK